MVPIMCTTTDCSGMFQRIELIFIPSIGLDTTVRIILF